MAAWGHHTVHADSDPHLAHWSDPAGTPVDLAAQPDQRWLAGHECRWNTERLATLIANAADTDATALWLFGRADTAPALVDRFDALFLLDLDPAPGRRTHPPHRAGHRCRP